MTGQPAPAQTDFLATWRGVEPELYRVEVIKRLPNLKTLDGEMVEDTEREEAANL